ncbi:hypothetical protein [Marinigracilibium pacificum]|uniref:Tetratricopeptide repeat protein n=1 Tax=Marinigracilibium pacificum TaxID=2729599 RepID=A0A848J108_9BACT|nr:hypothetical protein [Marinigracilibium pacificum]NMM49496.1 hypothetical protein [Marinigracilibium pacificum]
MTRYIILLIGMLAGHVLIAQNSEYTVLISEGFNQYKSPQTGWTPLQAGAILSEDVTIKTISGSYIGLVNSEGETREIISDGTINLSLNKKSKDLISDEGRQVIINSSEFLLGKSDIINEGNVLEASVITDSDEKYGKLTMLIPELSEVYDSEIVVSWLAPDDVDMAFNVEVRNIHNEVLKKERITKPLIKINIDEAPYNVSNMIMVSVVAEGEMGKSAKIGIKRLNEEKKRRLTKEINLFKPYLDMNSSLDMVILGAFFEEKGLLIDAIKAYKRAAELTPGVEYFRKIYLESVKGSQLR